MGVWKRGFSELPLIAATAGLLPFASIAGPADTGPLNSVLSGDLSPTHDPVIIREKDAYYVFGTGSGGSKTGRSITVRTSPDLIHWTAHDPLFTLPEWTTSAVPGGCDMWAPDISYFGGLYHMYYAVSSFGSNRSAIGLFTSPTLDSTSSNYKWTDEGMIVASTEASNFNAIDPNHAVDLQGRHWLTLGSFWTGIKLFQLNPKTGKLLRSDEKPIAIARRPVPAGAPSPIEAPFIVTHGGYHYLFASYDWCCKGAQSNYYVVVGRSRDVRGPYVDKLGGRMLDGLGTLVVRGDKGRDARFRGPGHNGFLHDVDGKDYLVYHAYDSTKNGAPTLRISPVAWDAKGWPSLVQ
ncbi:MAG: arabinan endo-1,5-alpha-L-arabinosidase [Janthinobacterium lividum]